MLFMAAQSMSPIATKLGRDVSTISREVARNGGGRRYTALSRQIAYG